MKKSTCLILFVAVISFFLLNSNTAANNEAKTIQPKTIVDDVVNNKANYIKAWKEPVFEREEPKRPEIPNLSLDNNLLDHIWDKAQENDFSYELILAIGMQESRLGEDRTNHNRDGSIDRGLMQINSGNIEWLCNQLNIKHFDPSNDYQNVDMAIELLVYERDYWRSVNLSEEQVFAATVISYHLGRGKAITYIRNHGYQMDYLYNVRKFKSQFEQSEVNQ